MCKLLPRKGVHLIFVAILATSALCQVQGPTANFTFRPPPSPTPTPKPSPSPTPTPTPTPASNGTMGAIINQRGLGTTNSPGINVGGAASLLGSRSYTYSVPMFALPGRHGLNLDLSLYYNSLIWETVAGGGVTYSPEGPSPSTGFRLDYGYIQWDDSVTTTGVLVDAKGAKHPLVAATQFGTQFNTVDSTYISVQHHTGTSSTDLDSDVVTYKNGSQAFYQEAPGSAETCCPGSIAPSDTHLITRPVKIEDTSGNFITINYVDNFSTSLSSVVDTVGRTITFVYANGLLSCVTDAATCNAAGSRTFNFSWNSQYILNYQFSLLITSVWSPVPPLQGSSIPYTVLSGVTRPDGTMVQFNYGDWMIVNDIRELSNNGSLRYEANYNFPSASAGPLTDPPTYTQQVVTTFDKDGTAKQATWLYQSVLSSPLPSEKLVSCFAVTDPTGTIHLTTISAQGNIFDGLPIKTVTATGSTAPCTTPPTTIWRSVATQWITDLDGSGFQTGANPRPQTVTTLLSDGTTQSQTQIASYDAHGNATDVKNFDFGSGKPGPLLRETVSTFASNLGNIFDRPTDIQIKDGLGNILSHEAFTYDNYSQTPLQAVSPFPVGFDSANFGSTTTPPRGNLTGTTVYADAAAGTGAINSTLTYDILGNMLTYQSGCCQFGTSVYSSVTQYAYPDSVSIGAPGSTLPTLFTYNMNTGGVATSTDYNGQKTQNIYDTDTRPVTTIGPDGITVSYVYDDAAPNPSAITSSTANGLVTKIVKDFSGRPMLKQTLNGSVLVSTTAYIDDAMGRPIQISNPYGPGDTVAFTNYSYDALGRVTSFTRPSLAGSSQNSYQIQYNATTFTDAAGNTHSGISVKTTDPAGKQRLQFRDAFGRLMRVDEPGGQPLSLATPNSTYYSYDAMGHLLQVLAGQQTRTYQYDSLGRVLQSVIPETGYQAASATYTDFGAPSQILDPRTLPGTSTHITTTFTYDTLNRLKSASYNDGTPSVTYTYGLPQSPDNTGGRLASLTNGTAAETYQYDLMGHLTVCKKTIAGQDYTIAYQYHPDGSAASITYPSGRIVAFGEDAIGRINQIQNNGVPLLNIGSFDAAGDVLNETYGNSVTGVYTYNNQLQLAARVYSTAAGPLLSLAYNYGGAQDSGQILGITDNVISSRSTSYVYDALGRLVTAGTNDLTAANTWQLQFAYDRYGNRLSEVPSGGTASMPSSQPLIDPTTNHVISQGYSYDAAGNMSSDSLFNYTFDALGEMTSVTPVGGTTAVSNFSYDAKGLRVIKDNTIYIYSGRKVLAEYPKGTAAGSPTIENIYRGGLRLATISGGAVTYHYADHLSGRVDTDSSGAVTRTLGHYPFGEIWYESGVPDKWKFTTYENDVESGLNYAGARFQSPRLGRFLSIDSLAGQHANPQSLNRYAYVNNDPINLTDPSGMECTEGCDDDDSGGGGGESGGGSDASGGGGSDASGGDDGQNPCGEGCTIILVFPPDPLDGVDFAPPDPSALNDLVNSLAPSDPALGPSDPTNDLSSLTPNATLQPGPSSSGLDILQGGLALAGFIPGIGDVANGINAAISLARGNYKDAALYALAAIPIAGVIGEAAIAARAVETGVEAVEAVKTVEAEVEVTEGIYEFTSASGKTYVGQSGNIAARIEQHVASGKLLEADLSSAKITEVLGGKTAREVAEQLRINELGGIENLENILNPIGKARQYLLPPH